MVKLVWTREAQNNRKEIFEYWNSRNKSKNYSKKLNKLFLKAINLSIKFPESGILTDIENVRAIIVRDYLVVYEISGNFHIIIAIWNTYQNPEKLKRLTSC